LGLSYAIQWVHELQLTNVDFEMDAKRVVDTLKEAMIYLNLVQSLLIVDVDVVIGLKTLRLSLIGDKRIWSLIHLQERPYS
jgi:ribonuclease HI